MDLFTVFVDIN